MLSNRGKLLLHHWPEFLTTCLVNSPPTKNKTKQILILRPKTKCTVGSTFASYMDVADIIPDTNGTLSLSEVIPELCSKQNKPVKAKQTKKHVILKTHRLKTGRWDSRA